VRTITIENAGFEFTLVQWLVLGNEVPDHRIIVSYGLITPLVSMSCRLLLRRVASRRVLPRERFSPLAHLRDADLVEQCPLAGVHRKTFAQTEFFSV
jgi:hypothetical protein